MAARTVTISNHQSLFDVAIQELGNNEAAYELAKANGLSVTSALEPGQTVIIPDSLKTKSEVLTSFARSNQKIATDVANDLVLPDGQGIGYMIIEETFTVS